MSTERNYARFYTLLRQMPGAEKDAIVYQFTGKRTTHLGETTQEEYNAMCHAMSRATNTEEEQAAYRKARRQQRGTVLHIMQKLGIDTADWVRVDAFCLDARICGKPFRTISLEELRALERKLRAIGRNGGLRQKQNDEGNTIIIFDTNPKGEA